jgi:predicted ATPase
MKIKKLHIKNFKSLVDLEIVDPNPFTVFVGANGVGKSNIFEALEFVKANVVYSDISTRVDPERQKKDYVLDVATDIIDLIEIDFGRRDNYLNFVTNSASFRYDCLYEGTVSTLEIDYDKNPTYYFANMPVNPITNDLSVYKQSYDNFSRIFIGKKNLDRLREFRSRRLSDRLFTSGGNLEKVLKRLLSDENKREVIVEYLQLFIPEFEDIEIRTDNIGGTDTLLIYEKGADKPFNKNLISDGTHNILCLLTAIYQSDEPQFLCIEEPENGLNPFVVKELVNLFRTACEEKGHYIWLNTHSQTLVEMLTPNEIILVDKVDGGTTIKQIKGLNLHGIPTDEAWFSGALGGGTPW